MTGIDRLLAKPLSEIVKKRMKDDVLREFERRLFKKHGMSIKLAMEHYDKFGSTLNEYMTDTEEFGKRCLNEILEIKESKNEIHKIIIRESDLCEVIISCLGDKESRDVLNLLFEEESIIPDILEKCNLPKTSGYRKIEDMIRNGIIVEVEEKISKSKKVFSYTSVFDNLTVDFERDTIIVEGTISKKVIEESTIFSTLGLAN